MSIFAPRNQQARPLGQSGAFRSGSLGDVAVPASAPWMKSSAPTATFQAALNPLLASAGYCAIKADGILGPATCGAAKAVGVTPPTTCQSATAPALLSTGCGKGVVTVAAPPGSLVAPPASVAPAAVAAPPSTNLLLVGGAVLAGAGILYFMVKKKG